jgi:gamma-glutamyltranspeptidase
MKIPSDNLQVYVEADYPTLLIDALRANGHDVVVLEPSEYLGSVQLILSQEDGKLSAASDPRTGGSPAGY